MAPHPAASFALTAFAIGLVAGSPAHAEWSTDPASNLIVSDQPSTQFYPQIAATPDGGFYVAWQDDFNNSYDVHLQRLDAAGNEVFAHNGIRIIDRSGQTGNGGFDLAVDASGAAILVGQCCDSDNPDNLEIVAYKVTSDGTLPWGTAGVTVSTATPVYESAVTASEGGVIAFWNQDGSLHVQKLDAAGGASWPAGSVIDPPNPDTFFRIVDLVPDGDGGAVAAWTRADYSVGTDGYGLIAQRFAAADGVAQWGAPGVAVSAALDADIVYSAMQADSAGGAVFAWTEQNDPVAFTDTARVQHLDAGGAAYLAADGVEVATTAGRTRSDPRVAWVGDSGDLYCLWMEYDGVTFEDHAAFAQRIDAAGERQFGATGKQLSAFDDVRKEAPALLLAPGGVLAAWIVGDYDAARAVRVTRLASDGSYLFPGETVDIKTSPATANNLTAATSTSGYAAFAWDQNPPGDFEAGDIAAQNIQYDGNIGGGGELIFANGFD